MSPRYRRGRDRGRLIETWWYHPGTGRTWKDEKERPHVYNEPFKSEDLEPLEIRFQKDGGHFFVDLPIERTITDESLRIVRHKLSEWIDDETATDDSDWEDKLLVSDEWEDENLLGLTFTHVAVKGEHYREWQEAGCGKKEPTLKRRLKSTSGCTLIDYDEKRFNDLLQLIDKLRYFRDHVPRLFIGGKSKRFETRLLKLCADAEAEFKKLPKKLRNLSP